MSRFFPAWCQRFLTGRISPRCQRGLPLMNCEALLRPFLLPFRLLQSGNCYCVFGFRLNPLFSPLSPMFFLIGWTRAVLSVSPILRLFREPDAHSVWFRIRSGTCGRRGSVSSPSWLCLDFMFVHNFPIGSEVCDFPLFFVSDPKIVVPLPVFIHSV